MIPVDGAALAGVGPVAIALALEYAVVEPPERVHPVALFGRSVASLDREWDRSRLAGAGIALVAPLAAAGAVALVIAAAARLDPAVGAIAAGLALFSTTSLRMLLHTAREVIALSADDLPVARDRLLALAGRDADSLDAGQIRSAAVESAAENLADGLVAPLLAFAVVAPASLSLGAGAAAWVKAVNTLDSMLGYRSKPVGWASARLDDLVMWLPARASAILIAVAAADPDALWTGRSWARAPPSPNSGWPMSVLAATLHVRLEKPGAYVLNPIGNLPSVAEGERGVRIVGIAGLSAYVLAGAILAAAPEVTP